MFRSISSPLASPLVLVFLFSAFESPVRAQLFDRATVIENARIVTMAGEPVEKGEILIKGSRIAEIGADVKAPLFSKRIDAKGATITPGLIDAWSALGRLPTSGGGDATSRAIDAIDWYGRDDFREALRQGVTTAYVGPGGGQGVTGVASVIQLVPGESGEAGTVIREDAAVCVDFASDESPIRRLKTVAEVRKAFRTALEYRTSKEDYEEDLEEYLEKLKERRKENEKEDAKGGEEKKGDKADGKGGEKKGDKPKEETPPKPKPEPEPTPKPEPDGDALNFLSTEASSGSGAALRGRGPRGEGGRDGGKNGKKDTKGKKDGEKKDDEDDLEKPVKPKYDATSELLLRALHGELPVRVRADRSADIVNALELAEDFDLDLVIEGGHEAFLVRDQLEENKTPVVLGPQVHAARRGSIRQSERAGAFLSDARVPWTVGSGGRGSAEARMIAFEAQLAAAGMDDDAWLTKLTRDAAAILGVLGKTGRLTRGAQADLVLWSGDPSDPASKVQRVYVAGKLAFVADDSGQGNGN